MLSDKYTYIDAIREGTRQAMLEDPDVILIGEGVPDPKAVFGSTRGLQEEFGDKRVFDMPVSENGITGMCIGAALTGLKPIIVHQRIDFTLYAMDQIVNNAAKWHSMYGGRGGNVPMVIRAIVGRGWGQGNQHSQCLSHLYAMIPGLKVVCPANAQDAKDLLLEAVRDPNPVMFIEHRWLHNTESEVETYVPAKIGQAKVYPGEDLTIVAWSYMVVEALKVRTLLAKIGVKAEVLDMRTIRPMDFDAIQRSVEKTGTLLILEEAWKYNSLSSEIFTELHERSVLNDSVWFKRMTLPDCYAPSSPHMANHFYPNILEILDNSISMTGDRAGSLNLRKNLADTEAFREQDIPDPSFKGPF